MTDLSETVAVTQADRDAAADYGKATHTLTGYERDQVLRGKWDARLNVQWHARARIKRGLAAAEDRDRLRAIVARCAEQNTISEKMDRAGEWIGATVERRIEMMGERRLEHDTLITDARAALSASRDLDRGEGVEKTEATDWIEWSGGKCPVAPDALVMTRLRSGWQSAGPAMAGYHRWDHGRTPESPLRSNDIIAYRVVSL